MKPLESLSRKVNLKLKDRRLNKLPDGIKELVEGLFTDEEILIISVNDLDIKGTIEDNYLVVTEKHLAVFSFTIDHIKNQKKIKYNSLQLEKIEEIRIEHLQNNAFLTFIVDNTEQQLLRFWDTDIYKYEKIAKKIIEIISKESEELKLFKLYWKAKYNTTITISFI